jgi:hypothetical protein
MARRITPAFKWTKISNGLKTVMFTLFFNQFNIIKNTRSLTLTRNKSTRQQEWSENIGRPVNMIKFEMSRSQPLSNGFQWNSSQTNRNYMEILLKVESVLLSALLARTGVSFYVNFVFFSFCHFYKLERSQNHCFWCFGPSGTFTDWFRTNLEFFMKTWFLTFPASFRRHFEKYFEEVPN